MTMLRAGPGGLIKSLKPEGEHSWQLHVPTFRVTGIELDMLVLYPFLLTWQVVVTIDFKVLAIQGISQNVVGNDAQPLGKKGHRPIKVDLESGVWILASKAKDDVLTRDLVFSLPIICQYDDLRPTAEITDSGTQTGVDDEKSVKFGASYYQAAVRSGLAAPYLLLHHQYHLQIAFLTQEEMENSSKGPVEDTVSDVGRLNLAKDHQERESTTRKGNEELYRGSIQAITDMLTFAEHIDDRALLTTFYLNQSYFHAACAYIRDMLQHNGELHLPEEAQGKTFPIPSRTAPSLVDPFQDYSQYPKNMIPATVSSAATASTSSYLTLIAKANYQCLREAIRDVAHYYSGAGWVDAVPDQREVVLRDVDLKIASDNIGAYIRFHDLKSRSSAGKEGAKVSSCISRCMVTEQHLTWQFPPLPSGSGSLPTMSSDEYSAAWTDQACEFLGEGEMQLNFDPQAFIRDYIFTGELLPAAVGRFPWLTDWQRWPTSRRMDYDRRRDSFSSFRTAN
ncbi:MAG: hypothetical protein Q9215_001221 [Flavoplaca cf. flavocitrina]